MYRVPVTSCSVAILLLATAAGAWIVTVLEPLSVSSASASEADPDALAVVKALARVVRSASNAEHWSQAPGRGRSGICRRAHPRAATGDRRDDGDRVRA